MATCSAPICRWPDAPPERIAEEPAAFRSPDRERGEERPSWSSRTIRWVRKAYFVNTQLQSLGYKTLLYANGAPKRPGDRREVVPLDLAVHRHHHARRAETAASRPRRAPVLACGVALFTPYYTENAIHHKALRLRRPAAGQALPQQHLRGATSRVRPWPESSPGREAPPAGKRNAEVAARLKPDHRVRDRRCWVSCPRPWASQPGIPECPKPSRRPRGRWKSTACWQDRRTGCWQTCRFFRLW